MFPLPPGAHIDKFSMDVNGKMKDAELLDADKARGIYEEIVRKYKDPALLEYAGRDAFKVRIFPIEPQLAQAGQDHVHAAAQERHRARSSTPTRSTPRSSAPARSENVSVKVNLACKEPIKTVYCPSHNVEIKRDGDAKATVGYEERNVRPDTDFKLIFCRTESRVGVDLLTYRNGPDDGYFLLLASPGMDLPGRQQVQQRRRLLRARHLRLDGRGGGKKMEQAKKALSFCLQNLNDGRPLRDRPLLAPRPSRSSAS